MLDEHLTAGDAADIAARLRNVADEADEQSRRLDLRIDSLHYDGPAARRFRVEMADRRERAQRVARRLHEVADRIQFSATST